MKIIYRMTTEKLQNYFWQTEYKVTEYKVKQKLSSELKYRDNFPSHR